MPVGSSTDERVQSGAATEPEPTSSDPSDTVATHDAGVAAPQPMPFRLAGIGSICAVAAQLEPPAAGSAEESTSSEEIPAQKPVDGHEIALTGVALGAGANVQAEAAAVGLVVVASCGLEPPMPLSEA